MAAKVGPVPVPAILLAAALGLGYYAYSTSRTATDAGAEDVGDDATGAGEMDGGTGNPIFLAGGNQGTPADPDAVGDNAAWTQKAVAALVSGGTPTLQATAAITKYVNGGVLTADEAKLLDKAVSLVGTAPETPIVGEAEVTIDIVEAADTNDAWLQKSVAYITSQGTDATSAVNALRKFLEGESLSFAEGQIRDAAVKQFGVPPITPAPSTTELYNGPATKQGSPPLTHRVIGASDNQPSELALLYYGSASAGNINVIKSGGDTRDLYNVGDSVKIAAPVAGVAAPIVAPLAPKSSATIINTPYPTSPVTGKPQASLTTIPTAIAALPALHVTVYANESMAQFQARMVKQYGFTPSVTTLKRLNTSATDKSYIGRMEFGGGTRQGQLQIR